MTERFKVNEQGIIEKPSKSKVLIESYSPGNFIFCPKCNSNRTVIFFGPEFPANLKGKWQDNIYAKKTILCNEWDIILKTISSNGCTSNSNPNWICKDCYDGGVVLVL